MELPRRWEKVDAKGDIYSPRTGYNNMSLISYRHTIVANNGDIYLFAGADSDSRTNDLFLFSIGKLFADSLKRYEKMVQIKT